MQGEAHSVVNSCCVLSDHASSVLIVAKSHELVYRLGMAKYKADKQAACFPLAIFAGRKAQHGRASYESVSGVLADNPVVDGRYGFSVHSSGISALRLGSTGYSLGQ
jgi:hypothetical protein